MNGVLFDSHSPSHWLLFKGALHKLPQPPPPYSESSSDSFIILIFLENLLPLLLFLGGASLSGIGTLYLNQYSEVKSFNHWS